MSDAVAEYDETGDSEKRPPICIEIPDTECLRGDMNNNDMVDLSDAVLVLQILTQMREHGVSVCADVNSDGRVGMEEVIYIMRKISG